MPRVFHEYLEERFPQPKYVVSPFNPEWIYVDLRTADLAPGKAAIDGIAARHCREMQYTVETATMEATICTQGSTLLSFPASGHCIALPPEGFEGRCAAISIGWRGRVPMIELERQTYLNILEEYFRS